MSRALNVISISEAAELCQVTPETIRRWVDQGEIPSTRTLGGHRRINLKDFQDFLKKRNMAPDGRIEVGETLTLLIACDDQTNKDLTKSISKTVSNTKIDVVQSDFEAGLRVANDEPDYLFFQLDKTGSNVKAVVRALRGYARTRLIRVVAIGDPGAAKKSGADFCIVGTKDIDGLLKAYGR